MNKKIPAIQAVIGTWTYYVSTLTFGEISQYVKPINDELHKSKTLSDAIQRSVTDNYIAIKDYILNQNERFFNSIVLAIYDGNPNWIEVELEIENDLFYNMGFLSLSGKEKIFPVDGQHRVEGIKKALMENPLLKAEKVPVILIGHEKTDNGMKRTRRLFSTLNRYAKPVSPKDIIALDEDDIIAITTRYLVENYILFNNEKVILSLQKAISSSNKKAFTSLITLSDCINELFKYFFTFYKNSDSFKKHNKIFKTSNPKDFRRFRPPEDVIDKFTSFTEKYWNSVINIKEVAEYLENENKEEPIGSFRNKETGGNILFRPVGIKAFVQATIEVAKYKNFTNIDSVDFNNVISKFKNIEFYLNKKPWKQVVWNPISLTMITRGNDRLIKLLFLSIINGKDLQILKTKDIEFLKSKYAAFIGFEGDLNSTKLEDLLKK